MSGSYLASTQSPIWKSARSRVPLKSRSITSNLVSATAARVTVVPLKRAIVTVVESRAVIVPSTSACPEPPWPGPSSSSSSGPSYFRLSRVEPSAASRPSTSSPTWKSPSSVVPLVFRSGTRRKVEPSATTTRLQPRRSIVIEPVP